MTKHKARAIEQRPYLLHVLSPLHAGVGQTPGIIDLPIARMKATGIPFVPGSSIKGRLRQARGDDDIGNPLSKDELRAVFGPDTRVGDAETSSDTHAGALLVSDARLLALPVRSFFGTFAWVTSPLLLDLAQRTLGIDGGRGVPRFDPAAQRAPRAYLPSESTSLLIQDRGTKKVYLQDLDLQATENKDVDLWADQLAKLVWLDDPETLRKRFLVVDDETMTYLWETATQVDTRVRLDRETRTVATGALWTEESLPPETLLIGSLCAERRRYHKLALSPLEILERAIPEWTDATLNFGGKATVGRGRCRMLNWRTHEAATC